MKRFRYTYYLPVLVCITILSCTSDNSINRSVEEKAQISLMMKLSETRAEGVSGAYDYPEERYISDVTVYVFSKSDVFIEKLANPVITGVDGDAVRTIIGELKANYTPYTTGINIVVLTNLAQRGVTPTISAGQTKADLYSQLAYAYTPGNNWRFQTTPKQYMPMWGIGSIDTAIKIGLNQGGNIQLHRAIARVDVLFNGGGGFNYFMPNSLKVTYYNNKGYCATNDLNTPYIPASGSVMTTGANFFQPDANKVIYRLYIPEYKNNGLAASNICKIELTGALTLANGSIVNKVYTLDFQKAGETLQDILRNHLYRFNITEITNEVAVTSSLAYEVEKWDFISVNVLPFN